MDVDLWAVSVQRDHFVAKAPSGGSVEPAAPVRRSLLNANLLSRHSFTYTC